MISLKTTSITGLIYIFFSIQTFISAQPVQEFQFTTIPERIVPDGLHEVSVETVDRSGEISHWSGRADLFIQSLRQQSAVISEVSVPGNWVEIVNPVRESLDMSEWRLTVYSGFPPSRLQTAGIFRFPSNFILEPGEIITIDSTDSGTDYFLPGFQNKPLYELKSAYIRLSNSAGDSVDEIIFST